MEATELEHTPKRTPILHRVVAGLVLVAVAALVIHLIAGLVMTIFYVALIAVAVIAVVWALRTIL